MNAFYLSSVLVLAAAALPRTAQDAAPDTPTRVSTLDEIQALRANELAVEIRFNGRHDKGVLKALAKSHPKLETLILRATGSNYVWPLAALSGFRGLKHLEIYDADSNLCYLNKKDNTFELQSISGLVQLETLRLFLA